jgi:hypothetical protein
MGFMAVKVKPVNCYYIMKRLIFIVFIMLPVLSFSQLGDDGKTFTKVSDKQNTFSAANTILATGSVWGDGIYPGLKYQYCKSFGAYASFKSTFGGSDYNHTDISAGPVKSLSKNVCFYLGGGVNFITDYYYYSGHDYEESYAVGLIEGGFVFKFNKFALDLGGGLAFDEYGFGSLGLGFNF